MVGFVAMLSSDADDGDHDHHHHHHHYGLLRQHRQYFWRAHPRHRENHNRRSSQQVIIDGRMWQLMFALNTALAFALLLLADITAVGAATPLHDGDKQKQQQQYLPELQLPGGIGDCERDASGDIICYGSVVIWTLGRPHNWDKLQEMLAPFQQFYVKDAQAEEHLSKKIREPIEMSTHPSAGPLGVLYTLALNSVVPKPDRRPLADELFRSLLALGLRDHMLEDKADWWKTSSRQSVLGRAAVLGRVGKAAGIQEQSLAELAKNQEWWAVKALCRRRHDDGRVNETEAYGTKFEGKTAYEWAIFHGETGMQAAELEYFFPLFPENKLAKFEEVNNSTEETLAQFEQVNNSTSEERLAKLEKATKSIEERLDQLFAPFNDPNKTNANYTILITEPDVEDDDKS